MIMVGLAPVLEVPPSRRAPSMEMIGLPAVIHFPFDTL